MMLAKACFSLELGLGQSKGIHAIVSQAREKDHPRHASQPGGGARRKMPHLEEFNGSGHENGSTRLVCCDLQGEQGFI